MLVVPYTLLLVDDDKTSLYEYREMLQTEYKVRTADSGEKAIEMIKKTNIIDLVLLDIKMEGMSGIEALKEIKAINPDVFVIMMTGYSRKDNIIQSLKGHADDFLEKPAHYSVLFESIKNLLDQKERNQEGTVDKLKYIISKNYHKDLDLKKISDIVCLSPKYISRLFKEQTGVTFNQYKLKLRIEEARRLLLETEQNINEISWNVGYHNVESFIRIFKKMEGCTPGEYRTRNS